ncbi:sigma factor-like helix-turn-helix DNA-binding protein [Streptosporangium canum]|uniref:sigma factor-like helix-turn-helix DNA-binding protein n=1 Tax=Streptosporangium canum TaxID=324952 RepID=UPI0037A91453
MSLSGTTPDPEIEMLSHGEPLARDRVDVAALFADHHLGLVRLALLMVGDQATAEDVVQEAFTRTHAGRRRLRDPERALAYIRSAVLNGSRSVLRRRAVAFRRAVPYEPPVWSAEHAALLGEERREALTLRYYLDLSDLEIAETMGIGAGTARSTIARGLAALARKLGEES